jgi:alkylhydroperoxidase family enzyme
VLWAEHVAKNTAGGRDDVFAEVTRWFNPGELVELTGICGLFAVSNRFQDSMRLPIEEQGEVDKIRMSVRADPVRLKAYVQRLVDHWPAEASAAGNVDRGPQAADESGTTAQPACRVPLPDRASVPGDVARFFAAAESLLGGLPNAMRIWGHVPHVGKLVLPFLAAIERTGCGGVLSAALKVLIIARTGHINFAPYGLAHARATAQAAGVSRERLDELATAQCVSSPRFSESERAALVWAQHVAQNTAKHHDVVFEELKRHYTDAEIVELTGLCAETNMMNRICNALRVPVESAAELSALHETSRLDHARLRDYLVTVLADWPDVLPVPDAMAAAGAQGESW